MVRNGCPGTGVTPSSRVSDQCLQAGEKSIARKESFGVDAVGEGERVDSPVLVGQPEKYGCSAHQE